MTLDKTQINFCPVAIIGMGCIFPGSENLKAYWNLLLNGKDAIAPIPEHSHWKLADYHDPDPARSDHTYCSRGGFIPPIAFDPMSYGIPPNNLQATDTSQLLGLEVARMALADAGYPAGDERLQQQKVNVILGVTGTQELVIPLGARLGHPHWKKALDRAGVDASTRKTVLDEIRASYVQWQENSFPGLLGNVVAGRIANRLNLSGTNAVSDAACASSLAAIHTAILELTTGRCDMSITGGVDTLNDIFMHMCFSKTGVLSHTSDARPFSKDADGTVLGEGIGLLVLKRLADAEKDKDRIYAVIRGLGTSSDGRTSAIYAPEAQGQLRALKDAYAQAGTDPSTVALVEAHGTGTRVGDKVEFSALKQCFGRTDQATAIGSVKSMIGHTKAAAGAAGIIKAALALHHKVIPPTLKAAEPDPELDICNSPFYLNAAAKPWVAATPRRSGVSAFGFGGSNFHAVLEEYGHDKSQVSWDGSVQIFAFSDPSGPGLESRIQAVQEALAPFKGENAPALVQAVAWQAAISRKRFKYQDPYRLLAIFSQGEDIFALLDNSLKTAREEHAPKPPIFMGKGRAQGKIGFLFPGQGSQYPGMARELMSIFPQGTQALELAELMKGRASAEQDRLAAAIYPLPDYAMEKSVAEEALRQTQTAQPAIGAVSMALTDILGQFKVAPNLCCGHSFGELSALYAAGWMDRETFMTLAAARGHYMAQAGKASKDAGSMLAVQAPLAKIKALVSDLGGNLVLANENSPSQGVLSGSTPEIDRALEACRSRKLRAVKLPVAAAFHSALVAEAAGPFHQKVASKPFTPTPIRVLSNTTGSVYPEETAAIQALLGSQLVHPVRFIDNIQTMMDKGVSLFIEVGPKAVLSGLVKAILKDQAVTVQAVDEPSGKSSGLFNLARVLCLVAAQGHALDLTAWEEDAPKPVSPKLTIMLSGANPKPAAARQTVTTPLVPAAPKQPLAKPATPQPLDQGSDMTNHSHLETTPFPAPDSNRLSPAVQAVAAPGTGYTPAPQTALIQKGLEAMIRLQEQTARAHEKFLETQALASRTLAHIMAHTRGEVPMDRTQPLVPANTPVTLEPVTPEPVYQASPPQPVPVLARPSDIPVAPTPAKAVSAPEPAQVSGPVRAVRTAVATPAPAAAPQTLLFDIVSRLTGFPVEMLEPQMDIESDLGIDSIKKVEIISELEKALPQGNGLSSEHLTRVRTLQDICAAISGQPQATADASMPAKIPAQAEPPSLSSEAAPGSGQTMAVLVRVISELTGFPEEMLEPQMNLESDLGIDSIKRVEILSRLEQALPDLTSITPDQMGTLKTLEDIVSFLNQEEKTAENRPVKKKTPPIEAPPALTRKSLAAAAPEKPLLRQEVVLKAYPTNQIRFYNGARIKPSGDCTVYLTQDSAGMALALGKAFGKLGLKTALVDLSQDHTPELADAGGLVIIPDAFGAKDSASAKTFLFKAFNLARKNGGFLMARAEKSSAFLATLTFSGGNFGFRTHDPQMNPIYGGLAGLAKTAGIEWKKVLCHALDLPADPVRCLASAEAAAALMLTHGAVEMGLDGDHCYIPELENLPGKPGDLLLGPKDVVVISGGAKGVTAECALALGRACSPKIALLGRSAAPSEEPEWLAPLTEAGDIKQAILRHEFQGQKAKPAEVQKRYQTILSNRAVRDNLARIAAAASEVRYLPVDIRDREAVQQTMDRIRQDLGPITVLIHGAGVLEDKLILEKSPDQFARVFSTKVEGLEHLMDATVHDPLSHVVLFSSVAARFGNQGQCDYAMANEVLNKFVQARAKADTGCRYLSINWGPWDGGMVDDSLKKEFSRRGIDLIPLAQGADQMVLEMANAKQVEVVIGASLKTARTEKAPILTKALAQTFGSKATPVLHDHRIDRQPVVPLAMILELMACAGEKNNPGLVFSGMDKLQLLKGIIVREGEVQAQVCLSRCTPQGQEFIVAARLESGDRAVPHAQATLILKDKLPQPPVLSKAAFMDLAPSRITPEQAYEKILFHGPAFQCITAVNGVSPKGIDITARCRPDMASWYASPHAKQWAIDPLMLDAAFQAAILWAHDNRNEVCLPNALASLRIYASYPKHKGDVRILFTVNHESRHKIQGYFTFLDSQDTVLASIIGFEALTDKNLMDKFKPLPLFDRNRILAFAQGNPSQAFGEPYKVFDQDREIARLPRPPYFFMDRVTHADHPQWEMTPGGWIETEYNIPAEAWYFRANRCSTMPFCILLEIALQPCGWLAAYAGSALQSQSRLHFRNLGGKATLLKNLTNLSGTLTIKSRMTEVSKAGGMIIQGFDMEVLNRGEMIYKGSTSFGFFSQEALANQIGIRNSRYHSQVALAGTPLVFETEAPVRPDDSSVSGKGSGMPATALRMIDAIEVLDFEAGLFNKGLIQGAKTVDPGEWFFDAHFYQDPVCPGSLGVESFLQLLRYFGIKKFDLDPEQYEVRMAEQSPHEWIYRGQIIPANKRIQVQAHISACDTFEDRYQVQASGALIVDGICIYEMKDFALEWVAVSQPSQAGQPQKVQTRER